MWIEKIKKYAKTIRLIDIKAPATDTEIQNLEKLLGEIPSDLVILLKELNGDGCVLLSVNEIIETNKRLRSLEDYMPLDCLLFFAGNGCGDYYGYQVRKAGICAYNIFFWDHEYDNRTWTAGNMDEFISKYCNGEI
ncbi:MAG: SMI1/KNR4 family protein [Oscillospiraceae bacterium]|jgi:hypothetical protein|nr:SMI1/KNR4 family protein [Oscillospiraceae bacterium]